MGGIYIIMTLVFHREKSDFHDVIKEKTKFYSTCIENYPSKETDPFQTPEFCSLQ